MVDEPSLVANEGDPRTVVAYLVATYAEDYVAIMDVLESSVTDLSPAELTRALTANDHPLEAAVVEDRLEMLRRWHAVHATTDSSRIRRHADLLARNWRYTATLAGRQVQRFYRTVLLPTPVVREIPLAGLNRVVRSLEALRDGTAPDVAEAIGVIFVSHDDLDAALIGAEDTLATLADRYDLNQTDAAELRSLLVDYTTGWPWCSRTGLSSPGPCSDSSASVSPTWPELRSPPLRLVASSSGAPSRLPEAAA